TTSRQGRFVIACPYRCHGRDAFPPCSGGSECEQCASREDHRTARPESTGRCGAHGWVGKAGCAHYGIIDNAPFALRRNECVCDREGGNCRHRDELEQLTGPT